MADPPTLPRPNVSKMGYNPGQATSRRIWRKFEGATERLIHEIPDNVTTKYQDKEL